MNYSGFPQALKHNLQKCSEQIISARQARMNNFTVVLKRAQHGDAQAAEELLPLVYEELRQVAAARSSTLSGRDPRRLCSGTE